MTDKVLFEIVATAKGVSVVQKQTDKLAQSTEKADRSTKKLSKSRDTYNRKEKGAAGISSNTTKNFSKMQQGIDGGGGSGGLVRAYALLAANVFALTAAFGVLSRSAQIDTLVNSMEILSTTGGVYIKNLARDMQEASGNAIDLAQSFRQVSLAASAGLNTKEIEGLTEVARGAAISLGRNLPDAMDRIFRGAIKLEPEILDEIGLFVRVDEASQKYAMSLNKSAASLTQTEKRQAFLNEILDQGKKKFSEYAEEIKPDPYVRLGAALGDIAQSGLSLINSVLGPMLGFLAENKGMLTAVFGVLVFSLIKKAIPALGQFNTKIADNAVKAAANAREYQAGLKASTTVEVQETNRKLAEKAKLLEADRKITGKGKARASQSPAAIATNKSLKTELAAEKRLELLRKKEKQMEAQILASKTKQQALLKADLADMQVELRNLEKQERLTKKIAQNTERGRIDPKPGQLADRRQNKLDESATSTTILAGASNKAEQQGMRAGFKELNAGLKENKKKLGTGAKAMTRFSGTVSILGTGISRLMMILGPWMMAFSILSPLIFKIIKAMGFMSDEAKTLDKSIKRVSDQTEKLGERFASQSKQFKDTTRTFREQNKAYIAFNKSSAETMQNIVDLSAEFEAFKNQLGFFTGGWEKLKGRFGLGREAKTIKLEATSIQSVLQNMMDVGDTKGQGFMAKHITSAKAAIVANANLQISLLNTEDKLKALGGTEEDAQKARDDFKGASRSGNTRGAIDSAFKNGDITKAQMEYLLAVKLSDKSQSSYNLKLAQTGKDLAENTIYAEEAIKMFSDQAKAAEAVESALSGASDNLNKFQASFRGKSNVDPAIASLMQLEGALAGLEKMSEGSKDKFFAAFKDADNPFTLLFKGAASQTQEGFEERLKVIKDDLIEVRDNQLLAAAAIKDAQATAKHVTDVYNGSLRDSIKIEENLTAVKVQQHKTALLTTKALLISFGITKEEAAVALKAYRSTTDRVEQQKILTELGVRDVDILSFAAQYSQELNAATVKKVAVAQQATKQSVRQVELQQKELAVMKEVAEIESKRFAVQAKLNAIEKTGTTDVRAEKIAEQEIQAAVMKRDFAIAEANLKFTMLRLEFDLLIEKRQVLEDEGKVAAGSTAAMKANLNNNPLFNGSAIKAAVALAGSEFQLTTSESIITGFKSGALAGIRANQAVEKDREERRDAAIAKAGKEALAFGPALPGKEMNARETAGKDFDKNEPKADPNGLLALRQLSTGMAEELSKLGPEGALIQSVVAGAFAVGDAWGNVGDVFSRTGENAANSMERGAAVAEAVGQSLSAISGIMAANSKAQMAEIDGQIAAEKRRDGKSKESLAKIAQMEKKKVTMAKKAFEQNKKMQIATTIANTAASVMQIMANPLDPTKAWAAMMIPMTIALGAAQVALIAKTKFSGGGSEVGTAPKTTMSVGKRSNNVDVSRGSSGGELSYLRGERGVGSNANNFNSVGAMGRKGYASGGEGILVGERRPEIVRPSQKVDIIPNDKLGGGSQNINFSINAVDASGVENLLVEQRGNIIRMIREAANDTGERFLETVDTQAYGSNT